MTPQELYSQGARCGHIDGKDRQGIYVIGEELDASWEAVTKQNFATRAERESWASGYRYGYLLGAEGTSLPAEHPIRDSISYISMTFGVMPTREQYDAGWEHERSEGNMRNDRFYVGNDPVLGTDDFSQDEFWEKLVELHAQWEAGESESLETDTHEAIGNFLSAALGCLGIEWVLY